MTIQDDADDLEKALDTLSWYIPKSSSQLKPAYETLVSLRNQAAAQRERERKAAEKSSEADGEITEVQDLHAKVEILYSVTNKILDASKLMQSSMVIMNDTLKTQTHTIELQAKRIEALEQKTQFVSGPLKGPVEEPDMATLEDIATESGGRVPITSYPRDRHYPGEDYIEEMGQ